MFDFAKVANETIVQSRNDILITWRNHLECPTPSFSTWKKPL